MKNVTEKVTKALRKSTRKQKLWLAVKSFSGNTIFEKKNKTKKVSLLCEELKKTVFDFCCSDTISSVGPIMKDRPICRDENNKKVKNASGKTTTIQKRYTSLPTKHKLFCDTAWDKLYCFS